MSRRGDDSESRSVLLGVPSRRVSGSRFEEDLLGRLSHLALTQIGHSRRIAEPLFRRGQSLAFSYVCETGFEHRRQSHHWLVVVREAEHECSRATITALDWLVAAAWAPAYREIRLPLRADGGGADGRLTAVVEDDEEWGRRLGGGLGEWLDRQPAERSWEIVPGLLVGYQAGRRGDEAILQLEAAADELATLLANG